MKERKFFYYDNGPEDWSDLCDHDELSCEDGDDDHWNGDLG